MVKKSGLGANPFNSVDLGIFSPTSQENDKQHTSVSHTVELKDIVISKHQPRRYFDSNKHQEMVQSIKAHGVIEPLLVRPLPKNKFELVAGERRFRAASELGLESVPVIVRKLDENEALQLALIENMQREDLNPLEETEGIIRLLSFQLQLPIDEVPQLLHRLAKSSDNVVGKQESEQISIIESLFNIIGRLTWESFATHRLPLLNLPSHILGSLREGKLDYTKARVIARVKDVKQQKDLLKRAIKEKLSLKQIREEISARKKAKNDNTDFSLKVKFSELSKDLNKSKVWEDRKKKKRLEKLLRDLESLLNE